MVPADFAIAVETASGGYHRLLFVVGADARRRTDLLGTFAQDFGGAVVDVSSRLSETLPPLPRSDRVTEVGVSLQQLVADSASQPICFDNIEVLFVPELQVDVLARLQQLSRNHTLVVNWPGEWTSGFLTYAETGHPEFFRAKADAVSVFSVVPEGASPS